MECSRSVCVSETIAKSQIRGKRYVLMNVTVVAPGGCQVVPSDYCNAQMSGHASKVPRKQREQHVLV